MKTIDYRTEFKELMDKQMNIFLHIAQTPKDDKLIKDFIAIQDLKVGLLAKLVQK